MTSFFSLVSATSSLAMPSGTMAVRYLPNSPFGGRSLCHDSLLPSLKTLTWSIGGSATWNCTADDQQMADGAFSLAFCVDRRCIACLHTPVAQQGGVGGGGDGIGDLNAKSYAKARSAT